MCFLKLLFSSIWSSVRGVFSMIGNMTRGIWEPIWRMMVSVFKFREDEVKRPLIVLISVLVIVGSLVSIFLSQRPRRVRLNLKPFEHLGVAMAEKTAEMVGNRGEVVLWRIRTQAKVAVMDVPIKHFRDVLSKKGDIRLIAEEEEVMNQPPIMAPDMMMGGMSGDKFLGLVGKYPRASALVLFGATPHLTEEQLGKLPEKRPKVFVVAMYDLPRKTLFENGIVQAAIVPRFHSMTNTAVEPQTPAEWFDRYYTVVTADNAASLPW